MTEDLIEHEIAGAGGMSGDTLRAPVHAGASSGTGNPGQVKPRTICAVHRRAPREREQDSCEHR